MPELKDCPDWTSATPRERAMARMGEEILEAICRLTKQYDLAVLDALGAAAAGLFTAMNSAIDYYGEVRPGTEGAVRARLSGSVRGLLAEMEARELGKEKQDG